MQASARTGTGCGMPAVAHQRLGRLREQYWRASGAFEVQIKPIPQPAGQGATVALPGPATRDGATGRPCPRDATCCGPT